ncbi:hypothetical protein [Clostridium ljungdahlii]|uniref:Uncharacterized protein n=1 Tax=Clostridium ljungdahlii TaxID=1538 RepID=A0A168LQR8_9CLOT|nr:hypothetical protein [Clostridium ljungdahlii]OAA83569.1 hypothetical protein WY13_03356 [Clostridium ljungdahlii]
MRFEYIEKTLQERYPYINTGDYIWNQLVSADNEYGSGWHDLIIELVEKIENIYKKNNINVCEFKIDRIREKYGELQFDALSSIKEVYAVIAEYENKAYTICDECGEVGSLCEKNGWLETLCEKCAFKNGYKKLE